MKNNCFVAVDKDGTEKISNSSFIRRTGIKSIMWGLVQVFYKGNERFKWSDGWRNYCIEGNNLPFSGVILPRGTIEKILGYKLTWKDEPVEIKQFQQPTKICKITNDKFSWILEVDDNKISFNGGSNAEYFSKLYSKLGYTIIIDKNKWKQD